MRRHCQSAGLLDSPNNLLQRKRRSADQQPFIEIQYFIVFIDYDLLSEFIGIVSTR